jgi:hypothetical protein
MGIARAKGDGGKDGVALTAAEAFVQSEAKSRIMPFVHVTFPGGRQALLTFGQTVSVFTIPIGVLIGTAGFFLHRRFQREALADPVTAGIFDPSVEWPSDV